MTFECRVNMTGNDNEDDYEQLKRRFCGSWTACAADDQLMEMVLKDPLKPRIREVVNSPRQLEKMSCIEDLLRVLEQRNALSEEKPQLLLCIALYCVPLEATDATSNKIKDWALDTKSMVKQFMVEHGIMSTQQDFPAPFLLSYKDVRGINSRSSNNITETAPQSTINQDDLFMDNCLHYLRSKFGIIGINWPQFVRALPSINEGKIQAIRSRKWSADAFNECLKYWKCNSPPEERNRETLIRAAYACNLGEIADGLMNC